MPCFFGTVRVRLSRTYWQHISTYCFFSCYILESPRCSSIQTWIFRPNCSLCLEHAHIDYVEQFLNETTTHLPRLTKVTVNYDRLTIVTENCTRDTTCLNCVKVKELIIEKTSVHPKRFLCLFSSVVILFLFPLA
jgi:hypothetical protein